MLFNNNDPQVVKVNNFIPLDCRLLTILMVKLS